MDKSKEYAGLTLSEIMMTRIEAKFYVRRWGVESIYWYVQTLRFSLLYLLHMLGMCQRFRLTAVCRETSLF